MSEGLGKKKNGDGTFLSVAGGYIWDRRAGKDHPDYAEQEFEKQDKTTGIRAGAQYGDLTGRIVKVAFRTHPEYGESINVTVLAAGLNYIVSISTNNQYSQSMMKALLVMDLEKSITMTPYDFTGADKKRAQGISFKQDGEKLDLKVELPDSFQKEEGWFKKAQKKDIKRYFEDLTEWYVAEVEEKVVPKIKDISPDDSEDEGETKKPEPKKEVKKEDPKPEKKAEEKKPEVVKDEKPSVSILAMKKALRPYIAENYPGQELPDLSGDDLVRWYNLCIQEEELPFEELEDTAEPLEGELSKDELDDVLQGLMDDEEE